MHIHRDSRQGSEGSPHAQMELRLWDLMPPRTNKQTKNRYDKCDSFIPFLYRNDIDFA